MHDLAWLQSALQAAIELELSTLPPYLCGLYALQDPRSTGTAILLGACIGLLHGFPARPAPLLDELWQAPPAFERLEVNADASGGFLVVLLGEECRNGRFPGCRSCSTSGRATNWTGSPVWAAGGSRGKSVAAIAVHLPQSVCQEMATPTRLGW